eukprot:m.49432 g.49432  ORF g.49432 m.49432 type:complete len:64 (-) comp21020_c1_seq1:106-297(-)
MKNKMKNSEAQQQDEAHDEQEHDENKMKHSEAQQQQEQHEEHEEQQQHTLYWQQLPVHQNSRD